MSQASSRTTKDNLIQAGISEIEEHGIQDFSLRRAALACNMSCSAPYKHFKSKEDYILAILRYFKTQWHKKQIEVVWTKQTYREQIIDICIEYIRFLLDNPGFLKLVTYSGSISDTLLEESSTLSPLSQAVISKYCDEVNMPYNIRKAKIFIVRSLVIGASVMLSNGQLPKEEKSFYLVRKAISREFDIPFDY